MTARKDKQFDKVRQKFNSMSGKRNDALFDRWSIVHIVTGVGLGWVMSPLMAVVIMVLWEPLEILLLSPFLARYGIEFGYETLKNSLSDIVFDIAGVLAGYYVLSELAPLSFRLFAGVG